MESGAEELLVGAHPQRGCLVGGERALAAAALLVAATGGKVATLATAVTTAVAVATAVTTAVTSVAVAGKMA